MLCKTAGLARQGTLTCTENLRRGALADMSKRGEGVPKMATLGFCLQEARVSRWRLRAHQDEKLYWSGMAARCTVLSGRGCGRYWVERHAPGTG